MFVADACAEDCLPSVTVPVMVRYFFVKGQLSWVGARTTVLFCKNVMGERSTSEVTLGRQW